MLFVVDGVEEEVVADGSGCALLLFWGETSGLESV